MDPEEADDSEGNLGTWLAAIKERSKPFRSALERDNIISSPSSPFKTRANTENEHSLPHCRRSRPRLSLSDKSRFQESDEELDSSGDVLIPLPEPFVFDATLPLGGEGESIWSIAEGAEPPRKFSIRSVIEEKCKESESKREEWTVLKLLSEIIQTERLYVSNLEECIQVFIAPLLKRHQEHEDSKKVTRGIPLCKPSIYYSSLYIKPLSAGS